MVNKVLNFPEFSSLSWLLFQPVNGISKDLNFESSFCQNLNVFTYEYHECYNIYNHISWSDTVHFPNVTAGMNSVQTLSHEYLLFAEIS
jgi:hypothetical protein